MRRPCDANGSRDHRDHHLRHDRLHGGKVGRCEAKRQTGQTAQARRTRSQMQRSLQIQTRLMLRVTGFEARHGSGISRSERVVIEVSHVLVTTI
jgi:hypothetical protein